ncbi:uncharacterized protein [Aquarana catesbeiana]|uniref:uncharacterized protein n=1 Tax=Aquarana catesbeiana TaxID=8400 RepID=UPI003CCA2F80
MASKRAQVWLEQTAGGQRDGQSGIWHSPGYDIGEEGYPDQEKLMDRGHPILVRTSPSEKDLSLKLMKYFGSNSKSGGGECDVTRVDGQTYCAIFQNQNDQRRVLGRGNHIIEITVPVTVQDIGGEDLVRIRRLSGDEERMKMLQQLAVRIPRISQSGSSAAAQKAEEPDKCHEEERDLCHEEERDLCHEEERDLCHEEERDLCHEEEPDKCPICLSEIKDKVILEKCKHAYCKECLKRATAHKPVCAICGVPYGKVIGDQPDGTMNVNTNKYSSLPGYPGCGTIQIHYDIPSGIQKENHPHPGKPFTGTSRTAYLPDNREGREILRLLRKAFDQRLIFTVGDSRTTGATDTVTWNDISHKTNIYGGAQGFGYLDPDYLTRVRDELRAKGIKLIFWDRLSPPPL